MVVVSNTLDLSRAIVKSMKEEFEINPKLLRDFGDLRSEPWGNEAFQLKRRVILKEPTVKAGALGTSLLGFHFDIIWLDDIVTELNQWTPEQRQKVWKWYTGTLDKCTKATSEVLVTGTRKNIEDYYSRILKFDHWDHRIDKALINEDTGEVLSPYHYPLERLLDMRTEDPLYFAQEMQNEPVAMEGRELKREWLRYYNPYEPPAFNWIFMAVDPAVAKADTGSYTATCLIGVTPNYDIYVLEFQRQNWTVEWAVKCEELWKRYVAEDRAPLQVAVENVMQFHYITAPLTQTAMPVRFVDYRKPVKGDTQVRDKHARIRGLGTRFMNGKIYLPDPNIDPTTIIFEKYEYLAFPSKDGYTDMLDALNLACNLMQTAQSGDAAFRIG
jgi:hypothetical protein